MNNKNKILVGCLALLLVLSVGYALFSETITINGTATAKGNFDITYTCWVATEDDYVTNGNDRYWTRGGTGTCEIVNGVIKTNSTLSKPTDEVNFGITLTNNGTIPAVLKTVDSSNNVGKDLTSSGDYVYADYNNYLVAYYEIYGISNGIDGDSESEAANFVLSPGESTTVRIFHSWYDSDELGTVQPNLPTNGVSFNYNVALGFEQVTAN